MKSLLIPLLAVPLGAAFFLFSGKRITKVSAVTSKPYVRQGSEGPYSVDRPESWPGAWSDSLDALAPDFRARIEALRDAMAKEGFTRDSYYPIQTWRSLERQQHMIDKGWSTVKTSYHTATLGDGTPNAYAVDFDTVDKSRRDEFYKALYRNSQALKLTTGLFWKFKDPGHVQPTDNTIAKANANNPKVA